MPPSWNSRAREAAGVSEGRGRGASSRTYIDSIVAVPGSPAGAWLAIQQADATTTAAGRACQERWRTRWRLGMVDLGTRVDRAGLGHGSRSEVKKAPLALRPGGLLSAGAVGGGRSSRNADHPLGACVTISFSTGGPPHRRRDRRADGGPGSRGRLQAT